MAPYSKNFITQVIARVDYLPILVLKEKPPIEFQDRIREQYPRFEQVMGVNINIKDGSDPAVQHKPAVWKFLNIDRTEEINISADYFAFTASKYERFSLFRDKLTALFNAFVGTHKPSLVKRVGLRYINEIGLDGNPFLWEGFLNANLFSTLNAFPEYQTQISRSVHQMQLMMENYKVLFNFGMFNSEFPNTISKKEFILDYDCLSEDERPVEAVLPTFTEFNNIIWDLFEKSIGDNLRDILQTRGLQ